ncbi:cytochrome P450, partial [Meredithblackwellia eburnea MCA 4105]
SFSPLLIITTFLLCVVTVLLHSLILKPHLVSPTRHIPGPARHSLFWGNLQEIYKKPPGTLTREWAKRHGGVVRFWGLFGAECILLTDPAGLHDVLVNRPYQFPKPPLLRRIISLLTGKGVLHAEGEDHARQRKILSPAFAPKRLRELTPIFVEIALKLKNKWMETIHHGTESDRAVIEVTSWLGEAGLDAIGLAGFGYAFNALDREPSTLAAAFVKAMSSNEVRRATPFADAVLSVLIVLACSLPRWVARLIPHRRLNSRIRSLDILQRGSAEVVRERREQIELDGRTEKKDLVSVIREAQSVSSKSMSDTEVSGQITNFLSAGQETTAAALAWALYFLSTHPDVQHRLREEVRTVVPSLTSAGGGGSPNSTVLTGLPYLDAVTAKVLRFEPPVSETVRCASSDTFVPLTRPFTDTAGNTHTSFPIKKGQYVFIPISVVNHDRELFGEDADVFRPERWLEGVGGKRKGVGLYSQLTFLDGPRGCLGFQFAIFEFKIILSILIYHFTFAPGTPDLQLHRRPSVAVVRPVVVGQEQLGVQLPLQVGLAA